MNENILEEIEPGVFMIQGTKAGPATVMHEDTKYYRFMDFFYIKNSKLDSLTPQEVSNLCRARAKFPGLITDVNYDVRRVFKSLVQELAPMRLLEIGAGKNPIFAVDDHKPDYYALADADSEVVDFHNKLNNLCYVFSEELCEIPQLENAFDMVIAVFVFHFPFHSNQIAEINKRLAKTGVIVANVYRRNLESREELIGELKAVDLQVIKIADTGNLCRDHEYWVVGKECDEMAKCAKTLQRLIQMNG